MNAKQQKMKTTFRKGKINYSDILILTKLFTGEACRVFVFDPYGKVNWDVNEDSEDTGSEKKILFNFGEELIRYKEFELTDFDYIIDFSKKIKKGDFLIEKLNVIQAPSGVLRYLFQRNDRHFRFLDFLATPTFRSKLVKVLLRNVLRLKQISWVGRQLNVLSLKQLHYHSILKCENYDQYAVFLGTPGFGRKLVIQLAENNQVTHYVKLPISPQTDFLVQAEKTNLKRIKSLDLNHIKIPEIANDIPHVLVQKAFHFKQGKHVNYFTESHFQSLEELMIKTMKVEKILGTPFYTEILDQLDYLENSINIKFEKLFFYLKKSKLFLRQNQYFTTSVAHGDFTPWNAILKRKQLYVYDWEMAIYGAPLLYDVFHFIYQTEILVNRKGIKEVEAKLSAFFKAANVKDFVNRFIIDIEMHHRLYLLHVISKNLMLISQQNVISQDQELLLQNWQLALTKFSTLPSHKPARESFLEDLQGYLNDKKYVALKFFLNTFKVLPASSDLDLAISEKELEATEEFISEHLFVVNHSIVKKSFMSTSQIHFMDGSYLSIDFIYDFIRKGKRYLNINAVLNNAKIENGVKRPLLLHNIEYAQHFYTLNASSIPLKYQEIFKKLLHKSGLNKLYLIIVGRKYKIEYNSLSESFGYSKLKRKKIKKYIHENYKLGYINQLRKKFAYCLDFLIDLKLNRGFMVTFSGVDGAGKTTIINEVKKQFEQKYRKEVVLLRHRPGILPILSAIKYGGVKSAEQVASNQLPRQGGNENLFTSLLRFAYYYMDYLFGQVYVYFKYILRGKVVIYDRYYFDFINDPIRSNIKLKSSFIKHLFVFIYKPEFNFYLYNDAAVILKRKQELSTLDIVTLNYKYMSLFNELETHKRGSYHQIKNDVKSETISEIFETINKVA